MFLEGQIALQSRLKAVGEKRTKREKRVITASFALINFLYGPTFSHAVGAMLVRSLDGLCYAVNLDSQFPFNKVHWVLTMSSRETSILISISSSVRRFSGPEGITRPK